jgi:broad specificity phosphatase PhoE
VGGIAVRRRSLERMAVRVVLVRHAEPAGAYGEVADPGLSPAGDEQARATATALDDAGAGSLLLSSPLRRARATAAPLEALRGVVARVEPAIGEIPSPAGLALGQRGAWLRELLRLRWSEVERAVSMWREQLVGALLALPEDAVAFTHFVAINAAVGAATDDDRLVCCSPGYCSRTTLEVHGDELALVELGAQTWTVVR